MQLIHQLHSGGTVWGRICEDVGIGDPKTPPAPNPSDINKGFDLTRKGNTTRSVAVF